MSKNHRTLRMLLLWGSAGLALNGACSSSDERQRAVQLAGGCLINSDCDKELICAFGRCHKECDEDRDCDHELRCVKNEGTGSFVCQLPDETVCKSDEHCPKGQVCAVDLECRDSCKVDDDCVDTQVCANSGECASTDPEKATELDENGNILLDSVSNGGTGGGGNVEPGAGAGGGTSSQGGEPPTPVGGSAGDASSAAGQGNTGGAPPVSEVDYEETPEVEADNGTRDKAVAIQTSANLYLPDGDEDWLSYRAPDDGRAHLLTLQLEQDANLGAWLQVVAGADYTLVGEETIGAGVLHHAYVSVGSGTLTFFRLRNFSAPGQLRLTLVDVPENDAQEPNDRWQDAHVINVGETVSGQVLVPYVRKDDHPIGDWFKVTLAAGPATLQLLSVPEDGRLQVFQRDSAGKQVALGTTDNAGALESFPTDRVEAGDYWFLLAPYANTVLSYADVKQPAYFTEQYSFTVTQ